MIYFPLKDLKRADYNPRTMPEKEMEALMLSIEMHGFVEPIVVNVNKDRYGFIVGGHQRLTAIEKLIEKGVTPYGIKRFDEIYPLPEGEKSNDLVIPAFEVDLSLDQEKALNLALNKIHGQFEETKLFEVITSLQDSPTLPATGFNSDEIANILGFTEGEGSGTEDTETSHNCARCEELKKSVEGHQNRSGHTINIE